MRTALHVNRTHTFEVQSTGVSWSLTSPVPENEETEPVLMLTKYIELAYSTIIIQHTWYKVRDI